MPALLTQQKADLPTEVEKSACFCARPAYGECARCNGPGRCNSPDSRHGAVMLPVRILPSHRSQFCNGGVSSLRRMPLQIRSCAHSAGRAGFVPISFAPLPDPQKGLRQAATPDQQAIFIFHFIIGIQGNKVNPRSGLFPRETTIAYRFGQKRLLRHLTKQPLSTVSCRLLSLIL